MTMKKCARCWKSVLVLYFLFNIVAMLENINHVVEQTRIGDAGHTKTPYAKDVINQARNKERDSQDEQNINLDSSSFFISPRRHYFNRKRRWKKGNLPIKIGLPKHYNIFNESDALNCSENENGNIRVPQFFDKMCIVCGKSHKLFRRSAEDTLANSISTSTQATSQFSSPITEPDPETESESHPESESEPQQEPESEPQQEPESEPQQEPESEPYPKSESEPNPESEAESESFPASESEPHSDPESETKAEAEAIAEAEQWPEPGPNWDKALPQWGAAWPFHVIFFSIIFILVSIVAFLLAFSSIIEKGWRRSSKSVIALSALVFSFSTSRTIFLCADAYGHSGQVPLLFQRLIFSVGLPGFSASFSNLLLIILDTTKATTGPPRFLKLSFILGMYCVHLTIVVMSDILVFVVQGSAEVLLFLCQIFFVVYGLLCAGGFFYAAFILKRNLAASKNSIDPLQPRLRVLHFLSYCSGCVAALVGVVNFYISVSEMGVFSGVLFVEAWQWWSVHTITRALEALACVMVLVAFMNTAKAASLRGILTKWCPRPNSSNQAKVSVLGAPKNAWLDTTNTNSTSLSQRCTTDSFQVETI